MKQLALFIFIIFGLIDQLDAQATTISTSREIVVIKGKEYYLHAVEKGQTLYSICKAYAVDLEEVKKENNKHENSLALNEIIKIPYHKSIHLKPAVEHMIPQRVTEVAQDEYSSTDESIAGLPVERRQREFYEHRVQAGETLYSIARMYDIKVRRILKFNKHLSDKKKLNIGDIVLLPKNEITIPTQLATVEQVKVDITKNDEVIEEKLPTEEKIISTEQEIHKETPITDSTMFYLTPEQIRSKPIKIALFLPLFANEQVELGDTIARLKTHKILKKSEQFLQFYEGVLVALDSLQRAGYHIDFTLFDTEKESMKISSLLPELNRLNPDLIIGPVYGSVFSVIANGIENKQTPIIYPLSARGDEFRNLINFVQVNPSPVQQEQLLLNWITEKSKHANFINMSAYSTNKMLSERSRQLILQAKSVRMDTFQFKDWNLNTMPFSAFHTQLSATTDNIIFFPSTNEAEVGQLMSQLGVLAETYSISLIGLPEWQDFASIEGELFYKLNVSFLTSNYINTTQRSSIDFAKDFRTYCLTQPSNLAYRAYDLMLYFVPLIADYRHQALGMFTKIKGTGTSSYFRFEQVLPTGGLENKGLFIITFSSNFELKVEPLSIP